MTNFPEEWIFINISSPTTTSLGGKKNLLITVADCADDTLSYFSKEKSEMLDKDDK